eukprot:sb/3476289/
MMLSSTSSSNQENLFIMSSFYRRYEDGSWFDDPHSYWSFQRRAVLINTCYGPGPGRFNLGVHTKRFLAISEIAHELMVPRRNDRPIRTRYLDHMIGYQPIRDQYFPIQSVSGLGVQRS